MTNNLNSQGNQSLQLNSTIPDVRTQKNNNNKSKDWLTGHQLPDDVIGLFTYFYDGSCQPYSMKYLALHSSDDYLT